MGAQGGQSLGDAIPQAQGLGQQLPVMQNTQGPSFFGF
jgi:hypothetical protein